MWQVSRWVSGWAQFRSREELPYYAACGPILRLRIDARALVRAILTRGFAFASLVFVAALLATQVIAWAFDLAGWRRDGLLVLPAVLVAPWVAAARRRQIEQLVTVLAGAPDQSGPSQDAERGSWRRHSRVDRSNNAEAKEFASAGSTSSWRSRASVRWQRWRSRASAR